MGYGDVLMSIGDAKRRHQQTRQRVMIVGRDGRPVASDMFTGIPYLTQRPVAGPFQRVINGSGVRPYVASKTPTQWTWRPYQPTPADIVFTDAERAFAEPYRGSIMIEPNVKNIGHTNKAWPLLYWLQFDSMLGSSKIGPVVQCSLTPERWLPHAAGVITPTFRHACAVLSVCRAFVGTEGGLMHAAAAVGVPAVILWSEFISPEITGYPTMRNLRHAGKPCGRRLNCHRCQESMLAIKPAEVFANLKEILDGQALQR